MADHSSFFFRYWHNKPFGHQKRIPQPGAVPDGTTAAFYALWSRK
jgi:hypothetical protein